MRATRTRKFRRTCVDQAPDNGCFLGGGGGGNTTTVQKSDPWAGVQPYLADLFARAKGGLDYGQPNPGFPAATPAQSPAFVSSPFFGDVIQSAPLASQGSTAASIPGSGPLAPINPYANQAAQQYAAAAGSPLVAGAQRQVGATLGGDYLTPDSNPYLQGAVQQALDQVRRNVNQQFSGDNYGSSANQEWLGKSLADTALPIYAQNYATERQNQLAAAQAAPGLAAQPAALTQQAAAAAQPNLDQPYTSLARYQSLLGSGLGAGGTTSSQSPYFTNPLASALGGGLAGAGLASAFPSLGVAGPWGFAAGAALGLLGGR